MFDAKQYHTWLQQIARVNRATGTAAGYDPDQLQLLCGECFMQLADRVHALKAFGAAQESVNPKIALEARANLLLIQNSPGSRYDNGSTSTDIVDRQSRKTAMSAMFAVELSKAQPEIRAARNAQSLVPL
jgi:hypothetical protein